MVTPGARNLITDVPGLRVGHAEDHRLCTGVTVVLAETPVRTIVDIRGGAPGTRETDALDAATLGVKADAIVLSGGSVFGLDAASGVTAWLSAQGRGFELRPGLPKVPIVPAAILFDLAVGERLDPAVNPYAPLGKTAVANAHLEFAIGNAGAGLGAVAGAYKGGIGSASATIDGVTVGALVAVNSVGSPIIPGTDLFWAFALEQNGEFGGRRIGKPLPQVSLDLPADGKRPPTAPGTNTTLAIIATDAAMTATELKRVAIMASDGFARALRPVHTLFDGDLLFALTTDSVPITGDRLVELTRIGSVAGDCVARAIARAVYAADSIAGIRSYRDTFSV
ncbi:MAG TPA: P1 family peptidase [Micropepsaceae bacterium]|nr:P1 family peptidase [Micropepsaceae bacterium]